MRIMSWNVNGLAACKRKGFLKVVSSLRADIVCLQEIKGRHPLSTPGYHQFWNPAQRPGYSGTLVLTRKMPNVVHYGIGEEWFDCEGRMISLEFDDLYIINLYVPNSQSSLERLEYRVTWDKALLAYLATLDKPAVLCGDFNVARDYIDVYPENLRNEENPPGFLSEEREGLEDLLSAGYADVFRTFYPRLEGAYTWWSNRLNKRLEGRGWRLDYFLASQDLLPGIQQVRHHQDILGSDHCPISLDLRLTQPRKEMSAEYMAAMWRGIDWDKMENELLHYQQQIAKAAYLKRWERVEYLQKKLVRSFAAKALAVRHVVRIDAEPGIDGVKWRTDEDSMRAALSLTSKGYHARPYRRIDIEEKGRQRKINVPIAYDKAMQCLYAYSLDPVAESTADKKSFAFRKGRSMFDIHAHLCKALDVPDPPRWIVRADVKSCYDTISHRWLLDNIHMDKKVLREFLKAGTVMGGELFPTQQGISQGATLSPILGNMVLDGLQDYLYEHLYPNGQITYAHGNLFRFADDIIIVARSATQARTIMDLLASFLQERGLALNEDKTYLTNIDIGFEFLSRHYQRRDGNIIVHPSSKAVAEFESRLETFIMGFKGSQKTLIEQLNRKLNGWASYHRITDAYKEFRRLDAIIQGLLARKMRQLHPKRQWENIRKRYWLVDRMDRHVFSVQNQPSIRVMKLADVIVTDHKPIRVNFHPYLDQEYYAWLQRKRDIQKVSGNNRRAVWRRQSGKCAYCGAPMLSDQELDLVEIILGKGRKVQNLAYIHKRCAYDEVTVGDYNGAGVDLAATIEGVAEPTQGLEDPYWPLKEFFRLTNRSPLTLTFDQIEEIIGEPLDWEAKFFEGFWFDEAPGMTSDLWDDFPFHAMVPSNRDFCISDAWRSQGYKIQRLHRGEERVVFRREIHNISGLTIPPVLLEKKLPDDAVYEIKQHLNYVIKKYGL